MSSVVCQTSTVAVTHRLFTVVKKGSLPRKTHKSCVTNISQGKFIAVYFHGYIKKKKESPMQVTEVNR